MSFRNLLQLALLFLLSMFMGCTTESCDEPTEAFLNMSIQFTEDSGLATVDSITIYGLDMQMNLLYDNINTSMVKLPLDSSSDIVSFVIRRGSVVDTIGVEYRGSVRFISRSCGYTFYYDIENISFTTNRIDNILIINREINPGDEENLRTFY